MICTELCKGDALHHGDAARSPCVERLMRQAEVRTDGVTPDPVYQLGVSQVGIVVFHEGKLYALFNRVKRYRWWRAS